MAKAAKKATTSRLITLLQVAARIGWEELQFALETGRLLAYQIEDWKLFEELARFRRDFILQGVPREDVDAACAGAIGYRAPIPWQSWRRWFTEGSVNRKTGKVIRRFEDRGRVIWVTFWPVLLNTDVPERRPTAVSEVQAKFKSKAAPPVIVEPTPPRRGRGATNKVAPIIEEAKRRIASGEVTPTPGEGAKFYDDLWHWWNDHERGDRPAVALGTIKNKVSLIWNAQINAQIK